jgi:glycosyltransferase involved in cell wall biosynthesis
MMRVLVITYDFPPSLEMGAHACSQLVRYLPLYGWEPAVVTVKERYIVNLGNDAGQGFPGRVVRTRMLPHPLAAYGGVKSKLGLPSGQDSYHWASNDGLGTLRRWILSLLKTPDDYSGWIPPAILAGLQEIRCEPVKALFSSGPCWSNHLVGLVLSHLTRLPWVAHFRDPWTGIPQWKPVSALSSRIETALERQVVSRAAYIVCVTDLHANLLRRVYPDVPVERVVTIPNGFDEAEWEALGDEGDQVWPPATDPFVITYTGSLYQRRNPRSVFCALRTLANRAEVDLARVRVDLVGWCDVAEGRRVREIAQQCGVADQVNLTGPLGRRETLRRMRQSSLLLLLAEAQPFQIPGKTYEYLRAGRPILALTSEGAVVELLRKAGGAWVVDPAHEEGVAAAVLEAYRAWERGSRTLMPDPRAVASFDRRLLAGRLAELLDRSVGSPALARGRWAVGKAQKGA